VHGFRALVYHVIAAFGRDSGDVLAWRAERGLRHVPDSAAAMPNGIAVSPDGAFAYVAAAGAKSLYRVRVDGSGGRETVARFDGHPDNLAWTHEGTLLVAVVRGDPDASFPCTLPLPGCPTAWSLVELDVATGAGAELLRGDPAVLHSVTSATRVGAWTFLGSMGDDRIGMVRAADAPVR
jgi:hypothetical protein